ncbi:hypothetical protein XYCOK13_42510 [Xylanibacillus composti]|uniref:Uncharacterized protein n=1 Tax=Xylanibacillus composti TaxID=1572762 RepID=A0A8J4H7T1_9BACL|nr:hypothetical protein XYCOK13_42510 [Xylanibacillus composti]
MDEQLGQPLGGNSSHKPVWDEQRRIVGDSDETVDGTYYHSFLYNAVYESKYDR